MSVNLGIQAFERLTELVFNDPSAGLRQARQLLLALPFATATWYNDPKTHVVQVGPDGKLVYYPEYVYAKPGDTVKFELSVFFPSNGFKKHHSDRILQ